MSRVRAVVAALTVLAAGAALAVTSTAPATAARSPKAPPASTSLFQDVTAAAALTSSDPALDPLRGAYLHASSWGDADGDGDLDLYVGTFTDSAIGYYQQRGAEGPLPNTLLLNDGGRFSVDEGSPALRIAGTTSGSVFADLDGDGDQDLVVTSYRWPDGTTASPPRLQPNRLFRNERGTFTDASDGSGIHPEGFTTGRTVTVLDADGDGCVDLFLVADPFHGATSSSRLLKGNCGLEFTDVTAAAGLASAQGDVVQGLGAAVGDLDGDTWPDLVVAGGPLGEPRRNFVFLNDQDGTFTEASGGALREPPNDTAGEDWTSGASLGDLDRDGRPDLLITHHFGSSRTVAKAPVVWMNRTTAPGSLSLTRLTGTGAPAALLSKTPHGEIQDIDDDGWPDLIVSVVGSVDGRPPEPLVYRSTPAKRGARAFTLPAVDQGSLHYYAGGPVADYDGDGRLDVFLNEWRPTFAPPLFRGTTITGRWLEVRVSDGRNRDGVGSRVSAYTAGKLGVESSRIATGWVQQGNGFSSSSTAAVHLGLGTATEVDLRVDLPNGGGTVDLRRVPTGQRLLVHAAE